MDDATELGEEDRVLAALAHASAVLGLGGWGPLILWLIYKDSKPFVAYHGGQAMVFHLGVTVVVITVGVLTCGLGVLLLFPWMFYELYLAWEAFQGKWTGYPGMAHLFLPEGSG